MPVRRKTYKRKAPARKPRVYKPKRKITKRRGGGPMRITNMHDPFPPYKYCKLHYTETFGLTGGTSGAFGTEVIYSLNNMYDPNYSGTGHQPYGRDTLAAIYAQYMVSAVKVKITFTNPSADGVVVGAQLQPVETTYALAGKFQDAVAESPFSWIRPINNTGNQVATVTQYTSLAKLSGLNRLQWNTQLDQYGAAVGSSPSKQAWLRIAVGSDSGDTGVTIIGRVQFTFYTKWWQRITLSQS